MQHPILQMNCAEIEAWIEQGNDVNAFETYLHHIYDSLATKSLLERAVELGCPATVRLLIEKGATLEQEPIDDFYIDNEDFHRERLTPLQVENEEEIDGNCLLFLWSRFFKNIEVCQILYNSFVAQWERSLQNKVMFAALAFAGEIGNIDVLNFLLARGGVSLINTENEFDFTPFHYICLVSNAEMVKILLDQGADPDIGTPEVGYPLMNAIHNRDEDIALLLIEHGARLDIQLRDRAKPLSFAKRRKLKRVVAAINDKLNASAS